MDITIEFSVIFYVCQHRSKLFFDICSKMTFFDIRIAKKQYVFDVLKAWDYARTIFESEKLRISYIKAEKDTTEHIFWHFETE